MQKQAPSAGRVMIAVGFALSCFGLLLFLWVAFGGPVPLKSEGYRVNAYFPEATALAVESDVRIGGVSVGKVKSIELAENTPELKINGQDLTKAEIEIDPEFAPISTDAKAILRQKTLLGETYVELTSGTEPGSASNLSLGEAAATTSDAGSLKPLAEGATLAVAQTTDQTQIDEIFNALDDETRRAFQLFLQRSGASIQGRGVDLNDSLGNLGPFLDDASSIVDTLRRQKQALKGVVRDTGEVFEALTEREQVLAGVITNSNDTFGALAQEERALAEIIQIFPTFQRESRLTFERLDDFQVNTRPLIRDLLPVANDISPTLRSLRQLAPRLESLFVDLDALNKVSVKGLPALSAFLKGARPLFKALDPFLANLNPVLRYLKYNKNTVTDFLSGPPAALAATLSELPGQVAPRHQLRQISYTSSESLSIHPSRLSTNRGNGYFQPFKLTTPSAAKNGIFGNFDCNITGERFPGDGGSPTVGEAFAPCFIESPFPANFGGGQAPQLFADP